MAFRYTPTPTPSVSPTISLTPSISPTITPSSTSCPDSCCFPNSVGSFLYPISNINFLKFNDDFSFFMFGNALDNLNGVSLLTSNRISSCGDVLNAYNFDNVFYGGVDYGGVATQSTDKILVIEEKSCRRLDADYSIDLTFSGGYASNPSNENAAFTTGIALGENDKYYISGVFTGWTYYSVGSVVGLNTNIWRFNPDGTVDTSFSGNTLGVISGGLLDDPYMFNDYDGKVMITTITSWGGDTNKKGLIRLYADGTLDTTFSSSVFSGVAGTTIYTATPLSNGKYMVGGEFTNLLGIANQDYLVRLNNDGSLDTTFVNGGAAYQNVKDVEPQSSGKLIVFAINRVFRLNVDGSIDTSFTQGIPSTANNIGCISISPIDTIIVGSNFASYNSQPYNNFVKLDEDGNLNMCPLISPTPTPTYTPTNTATPTGTIQETLTPTTTATPTATPITVYSGDIWFGTIPSTGFNGACDNGAPQQYLYWSGAQLLYAGLVFYTDVALLFPYNNVNGYTYCRSDGSGGGFDEMNLSGSVVGPATGTIC